MPKLAYGDQIQSGDHLAATLEALVPSQPQLRPLLRTLQGVLRDMRTAKTWQLALRAAAQQATRDLEAATEKVKQTSVQLHCGLLAIHGTQSAQLLAFGMRPHRSARRSHTVGAEAQAVVSRQGAVSMKPMDDAQTTTERGTVPLPVEERAVCVAEAAHRVGDLGSGRGAVPRPEEEGQTCAAAATPDGADLPQPGAVMASHATDFRDEGGAAPRSEAGFQPSLEHEAAVRRAPRGQPAGGATSEWRKRSAA
jgi:hypothetical protein